MKRYRRLSPILRVAAGVLALASIAPLIGIAADVPKMPPLGEAVIMAIFGILMAYASISGNAGATFEPDQLPQDRPAA
jgi:hypothetical protein